MSDDDNVTNFPDLSNQRLMRKYDAVRADVDALREGYGDDPERQWLFGYVCMSEMVEGHGGGSKGASAVMELVMITAKAPNMIPRFKLDTDTGMVAEEDQPAFHAWSGWMGPDAA
jgi:hypothetical protein